MADLSNYSMADLIQEWIMDRARGPLLLQKAVDLDGVDAVIAFAVEQGVPRGTIMFSLRRAGCIEAKPKEPKPDADPFLEKVETLWRKDRARLMQIVNGLYNAGR